ncbi:hypothetical protein [Nocardiopsis lambiniae]|uniref:Transmembrane protein n=1 Tax=Nocardiopsis lambiniae TaxID=3075539 RepID=A0ABU2M7U9_9ACTN|nr:hypothetical protein [Nocardiopsis sp. DSM 44743]MDT0328743.1 hypothetical protein [Nocardiopsis sp. DSM 44743]
MNTTAHAPRTSGPILALQGLVLLITSAITAWWVSHTPPEKVAAAEGFPLGEADYAIRPLPLPGWAETVIGIGAAVLMVATGALLIRGMATRRIAPLRGLTVLLPVPIALMAGVTWAIATAPVIGANIGLGLAVMAFGAASALLLVGAVVTAVFAHRASSPRPPAE